MSRRETGRIKCEGCDGFGVRPDSTPHAGKVPEGWTAVERCDTCSRFLDDTAAAQWWGTDVTERSTRSGIDVICKKRVKKIFVIEDPLGGGEICKTIDGHIDLGFPWYKKYTGPLLFETEEIADQFMKDNRDLLENIIPVSRLKVVPL